MSRSDKPTFQPVTPQLRAWIVEQHQRGCLPQDILAAMRASGWHAEVAAQALAATLGQAQAEPPQAASPEMPPASQSVRPVDAAGSAAADRAPRLPEPDLRESPALIHAGDRDVRVVATMRHPRIVVFGDLLSPEECRELIALSRERLRRSETVETDTGGSEVNEARTSDGMFFQRGENALCARIEARIAALLRWPVENGEGLQILRYGPGARYEPHYDYFDPSQPGTPSILRRGGQRVGTVVMYLQAPAKGGGTAFPDVDVEVAPVPGHAVFFSYDRPDPATRTLHGGSPVLAGEKWIATKWLREGRFD